jgi:predicted NUDIX family NTP pyrophosphohydrolase
MALNRYSISIKSVRTKQVLLASRDSVENFSSVKRWAIVRQMDASDSLAKPQKRSRVSAGLMMFRHKQDRLELLLVHPGGPFFAKKDEGAWTIPKGEATPRENLLERAQIEFEEELGVKPSGSWIPLGSIKQKGGKTVHAWAFERDLPKDFELRCNTFQIQWPPHSGKMKEFPEIDRAEFFPEEIARRKINPAQIPFLGRLRAALAL